MSKSKKDEDILIHQLSSIQRVYNQKKKLINYALIGVLAIAFGIYYYFNMYLAPLKQKAYKELYVAESYFFENDWYKAINGDKQNYGLVTIISTYPGTPAANLAHYYLGIAYLKTGEFQNAVNLLNAFKTDSDILNVVKEGSVGDAYFELGEKQKALEHFKNSIKIAGEDNVYGSIYLRKAALLYEDLGSYSDALSYFEELKKKFPLSQSAAQVDGDIMRLKYKIKNKVKV